FTGAGHSRHPSLNGLSGGFQPRGMSSASGQHGNHTLPRLDTQGFSHATFDPGPLTAPPFGSLGMELGFDPMAFGTTVNPQALHFSDSPNSLTMTPGTQYD